MKHILMLMLSVCLIFSACDKSKEEPSIEGKTCQISTVAYETLKYDEQGRISNISHKNDPNGTLIAYSQNSIAIVGSNRSPDIKLTLADGRVTKAVSIVNGSTENYEFTYNTDGYLKEVAWLRGGEVYTYTYSYSEGNLTKIQATLLSSGKLSTQPATTIEYSTELAANIADIGVPIEKPFSFSLYKIDKYFGKQSKNLVSKMTRTDVVLTYTYTKDVNGNITSVKRSGLDPYLIKYSCK